MMNQIFKEYRFTEKELAARADGITEKILPDETDIVLISRLLGCIDLTTLEGSDTQRKVTDLCRKAQFSAISERFPEAAAVCVYPSLVKTAVDELKGTAIRVASVAGGFPSGQTGLRIKLEEVKFAVNEGADEIDTVISRGKLIGGDETEVFDELCAIREMCGPVHMKVILETGELPSVGYVRRASELAIAAGADFIKTSTGKISEGATAVPFLVMLDTIREYHDLTGKTIGIKPAGGIRTFGNATVFTALLIEILGDTWFCKESFRIGASSLADDLVDRGLRLI